MRTLRPEGFAVMEGDARPRRLHRRARGSRHDRASPIDAGTLIARQHPGAGLRGAYRPQRGNRRTG